MKILLGAVNAKYIHTNLAVHSLLACCREFSQDISPERIYDQSGKKIRF